MNACLGAVSWNLSCSILKWEREVLPSSTHPGFVQRWITSSSIALLTPNRNMDDEYRLAHYRLLMLVLGIRSHYHTSEYPNLRCTPYYKIFIFPVYFLAIFYMNFSVFDILLTNFWDFLRICTFSWKFNIVAEYPPVPFQPLHSWLRWERRIKSLLRQVYAVTSYAEN